MRRVLAITVGGEPDPIATAVERYEPDFTIFFVTTEPNGGSRRFLIEDTEKGQAILRRTKLPKEAYEIITLPNPDDLEDCFRRMYEALKEHNEAIERIADYTGGTKTMSTALVLAALGQEREWDLSVVTGVRRDTVKVAKGTELARRIRLDQVRTTFAMRLAQDLYERKEYAGAAQVLEELSAQGFLTGEESRRITDLCTFLRALAAWDRLAYEQALELMRQSPRPWPAGCATLSRIWRGGDLDYATVEDLVGNAFRRAEQGRHEDAILRLYRAVELLAQLRLRHEFGLNTEDLDLNKLRAYPLPEDLDQLLDQRKKEGRAWAGLWDAYRVLAALNDPVGQMFAKEAKDKIRNLLSLRNQLFLEHGMRPVHREEWEKAKEIALEFLEKAFAAINRPFKPVTFPAWKDLEVGA